MLSCQINETPTKPPSPQTIPSISAGNTATDDDDFMMDSGDRERHADRPHNDGYNINLNEFLSDGGERGNNRGGGVFDRQSVTAFGWHTSCDLRPIKEEYRPGLGSAAPLLADGIKVEQKPVVLSHGRVATAAKTTPSAKVVDEEEDALFDDLNPD